MARRQSFYVVNQQRASDFLNLEWSMPLWDGLLMKFQKVPLELQLDQKLYTSYLKKWNYNNLFEPLRVSPKSWEKLVLFNCFGQCIKFLFGNLAKERFYKLMDYYSANNFQYNYFTFIVI